MKPGLGRGFAEARVGREEGASGGAVAAPDEGSGELEAVCSAEGVKVEEGCGLVADRAVLGHFVPLKDQVLETENRLLSGVGLQCAQAMQARDGARHLYARRPPDDLVELTRKRSCVGAVGLLEAEGHQGTGIPKGYLLDHIDSSRSSRRAWVPAFPSSLGQGSLSRDAKSRGRLPTTRMPSATSERSSSVRPSSGGRGMSWATGVLRSRIRMVSPALA